MSGPEKRPPAGDPDDSWPSDDRLDPTVESQVTDRWSADDPWPDPSANASSGWAAWPATDPTPEDDLPDDATLPVNDPWAESWTDESPAPGSAEPPPWSAPAWTPSAQHDASPQDVWAHPAIREPEPETAPDPDPEPGPQPQTQYEPDPEPEPEPEPTLGQDPAWPVRGDATQVLPTSWSPPEAVTPDRGADLEPAGGRVRVSLAQEADDPDADETASTAEQAVPWLIGIILFLTGMVILLLALIFAGDASMRSDGAVPSGSALGVLPSAEMIASTAPTPTLSVTPSPTSTPRPTEAPSPTATATPEASPTPVAGPVYGALEMIYQGRSAALAPIYLIRRDFTQGEDTQQVLAQDPSLDVRGYAWSPDGTVGAGLLADVLVSIEPGKKKRRLADGISTITFGADASTLYAVRVAQDGGNDVARILEIDFKSGDETELAAPSYTRPEIGEEDALSEAQFSDEGGAVRLYWMDGGTLRLWALGAGTWEIDPADGSVTELEEDDRPTLWAPDADQRITTKFEGGSTTLALVDEADEELFSTMVKGRVSHIRWAPDGERVVFTAGRANSGGGVLQDLFLWDLNEEGPNQLTATGAAFGSEWRGTHARWRD
ncbi:MAG: hypothetical protein M3406_00850 [Chloroflexota bacterium]|nr:hypothetical protein [Chloroflexota bacterium]